MRKKIIVSILFVIMLTGCGHKHEWKSETCTEPKTCTGCEATEGVALGHSWTDATCTKASECTVCGEKNGEALGHSWTDATCNEAKVCNICGETEGKALGHSWEDATCNEAKTCKVCGETEGKALGHKVEEWEVTKVASCSEVGSQTGICKNCEETVTEEIAKEPHAEGEWVVTEKATSSSSGKREKSCQVCGEVLQKESYELGPEEIEAAFKSECVTYGYDEIARNPDSHMYEKVYFKGEVIQVMESDDEIQLRVNITQKRYYWDDTIYVVFEKQEGNPRILEDDIITIYGYSAGTISYTSVLGATITVPAVLAMYIDY